LTNSIADVNNALVDDGLVDKEKISGANYYWSFPAKKDHMAQVEHRATLVEIEKLKVQAEQAACKLADAKRGREDTATTTTTTIDEGGGENQEKNSRPKKLARLAEMAREKAALETELDSLKENDPAALADLQKELKLVTQGANRWTDNIFQCKTYLMKKRGMDKKEVVRTFCA
jgi:Leucine zipper with capping helix domain/Mnd1 HTH domain